MIGTFFHALKKRILMISVYSTTPEDPGRASNAAAIVKPVPKKAIPFTQFF
jgi:hypothetical protein